MGSGLILLVIVGAWLAVLVPMFLRSHDHTVSMSSVDRFSDAMRVLSRRDGPGRRTIVMPSAPVSAVALRGPSLAERRRRTMLGLLGASLLTLVLGVFVSSGLLVLNLLVDLLLAAFVVHCRRQARLRQARLARLARASRVSRDARDEQPVRREAPRVSAQAAPPPARVAATPSPAPAAAARHEDPLPRTAPAAALGETWSPVPVPVPTYVNAPVAGRRPRVLDLTRPGEWSTTLEGDDDAVLVEDGRDIERILDRRRAVND